MYVKYRLQKKQVSHNNGETWIDVSPIELKKGESVGTYETLAECEGGDYSTQYLTFESLEDGNVISLTASSTSITRTISASTDDGSTWTEYTSSTGGTPIATLDTGEKVLIKGENTNYGTSSTTNSFSSTKTYNAYGNIMSLISGDNFEDNKTISSNSAFYRLFGGSTGLTSAENLVLPANTLKEKCYEQMFMGCRSLTKTPKLPATLLTKGCYQSMFAVCTSLVTAPQLSSTTLAQSCYQNMFEGCTSLTTAPVLSAATLEFYCYESMFQGCTSLATAPELPSTTLANCCYYAMFRNCTSLTTAPVLSATTLAPSGYSYMFEGCTSLTTAPELPSTSLAYDCYRGMFRGCSSLATAPELPTTTFVLANNCYQDMFSDCTSLTTAPELPATKLVYHCYYRMFQGCTSLNSVKCLATDIVATDCTYRWLYGVSGSGTFTKASSMSNWTSGTSGIPDGWTVQNV